jgi:hypothetical protein
VTPSQPFIARGASSHDDNRRGARRSLLGSPGIPLTTRVEEVTEESTARKRLAFGRLVVETPCQKNVQDVYKIISKLTGSVGGNGSFGAIYGELTIGSMQKIVDLMKIHTGFSSASRFIDVGSGLGKPNIHVCQDPGVEFSYGIEMEMSRWMLGMSNLQAIIKTAKCEETNRGLEIVAESETIGSNCFFDHGNIMDAASFDPFTHVYMFSIGYDLKNRFNMCICTLHCRVLTYCSPPIPKTGFHPDCGSTWLKCSMAAPRPIWFATIRHPTLLISMVLTSNLSFRPQPLCMDLVKDTWAIFTFATERR